MLPPATATRQMTNQHTRHTLPPRQKNAHSNSTPTAHPRTHPHAHRTKSPLTHRGRIPPEPNVERVPSTGGPTRQWGGGGGWVWAHTKSPPNIQIPNTNTPDTTTPLTPINHYRPPHARHKHTINTPPSHRQTQSHQGQGKEPPPCARNMTQPQGET
jgi:hypothetical protein